MEGEKAIEISVHYNFQKVHINLKPLIKTKMFLKKNQCLLFFFCDSILTLGSIPL
jgi:hypothetical protein